MGFYVNNIHSDNTDDDEHFSSYEPAEIYAKQQSTQNLNHFYALWRTLDDEQPYDLEAIFYNGNKFEMVI